MVARDAVARAVGEDARVLRPVPLEELLGTRYQRAFDLIPVTEEEAARGWTVVADEYVTTGDGSGLVQTSPAYGAEDLAVGQRYGTPVLHPVGLDGTFGPETGWLAGRFVKEADADLVEDLRRRGLLWRAEPHRHAYPFCWRCGTPLIYYALTSWYARTTAVKDRLLAENAGIGWRPEHIRDGRFGDWLANNVDWALSRARYWGTPLPLWRCADGHVTVVESLADLSARAGRDLSGLDPHRPFVDEVAFACPDCGQEARRVPDVLDAWFDSGSMPFAQWGYPHAPEGRAAFEAGLPGRLHLRGHRPDPRLVLLAAGREHAAVRPDLVPQRGLPGAHRGPRGPQDVQEPRQRARPVRAPGPLRGRPAALVHAGHRVAVGVAAAVPPGDRGRHPVVLPHLVEHLQLLLPVRPAGRVRPDPPAAGAAAPPTPLDRWVLAELADTVEQVTRGLDDYDATGAARRLAAFVDDLSNWYVRLSRRRFWRGTGDDADAAFRTLWTCLRTVALLLAPYAPFTAEELWQGLVVSVDPEAPDSVHLADWPEPDRAAADPELSAAMAEVRRLVGLGRQARTEAKLKVRQPLARALIGVPDPVRAGVAGLLDLVAAELNVKEVGFAEGEAGLVAYRLAPNFRALGPRFGRDAQAVAAALRQAPAELAAELAPRLRAGERVELAVDGLGRVELGPEEAGVVEEPVTGWRVVRDGATAVALDLEVSPELRREGLARDLVRAVQDLRKAAGLEVADRIELAVKADGEKGRGRGRRPPRLPARRDPGHQPAHRPPGRRPRHPGRPGRPGGPHLAAPGARRGGGRGAAVTGPGGVTGPAAGRMDDLGDLLPAARSLWGYVWAGAEQPGRAAGGADHPERPVRWRGVLLFEDADGGLARFLRWRGFAAITLGHVIVTNRRLNDGLLAHELEHVAQARALGPALLPGLPAGQRPRVPAQPVRAGGPPGGRRHPGRPGGARPGGRRRRAGG